MKILNLLALFSLLLFIVSCQKDSYLTDFYKLTHKEQIPPPGYELVWSDEFDGDSLDFSKWNYRLLGHRGEGYQAKEAISLDGQGHLMISTYVRNDTIFTGMIGTQNIFEKKYGYFECKARITQHQGHYPAFWLQSPRISATIDQARSIDSSSMYNGAEIDIFEYFNHGSTNRFVSHGIYYGGYGANIKQVGPWTGWAPKLEEGYHTFGLEWTPNEYTFNIDGYITWKTGRGVSGIPQYIILSDIVAQNEGSYIKEHHIHDVFLVDYVRVYNKVE